MLGVEVPLRKAAQTRKCMFYSAEEFGGNFEKALTALSRREGRKGQYSFVMKWPSSRFGRPRTQLATERNPHISTDL